MNFKAQQLLRRIGLWGGAVVAVVAVFYGLMKLGEGNRPPVAEGQASTVASLTSADHVQGSRDSKVVLVEYSDFECPACKAYHPMIKQLVAEFGNRIAFVYRHFPLQQHTYALDAARAAEAASAQGKFWQYYDMVFERQRQWAGNTAAKKLFEEYALELGLLPDQFKADRDGGVAKDKVAADQSSGLRAGVNSTPTFFLNNIRIAPTSYDQLRELVDQELKKVSAAATSTPS